MVQSPHMSVSSKGVTGQSPDVEVSINHVVAYKDEEKGFKREDRCLIMATEDDTKPSMQQKKEKARDSDDIKEREEERPLKSNGGSWRVRLKEPASSEKERQIDR